MDTQCVLVRIDEDSCRGFVIMQSDELNDIKQKITTFVTGTKQIYVEIGDTENVIKIGDIKDLDRYISVTEITNEQVEVIDMLLGRKFGGGVWFFSEILEYIDICNNG